jgi:hypothetical protein
MSTPTGEHPVAEEMRRARYIAQELVEERERQVVKWGTQREHPDGLFYDAFRTPVYPGVMLEHFARGNLDKETTWAAIFMEEVGEALQADNDADLRAELVQVAAVAMAWIDAIDRRR